jgi:hypothetical protein
MRQEPLPHRPAITSAALRPCSVDARLGNTCRRQVRGRMLHADFTHARCLASLSSAMILRRVVGALLMLLVVQYATPGVAPMCEDGSPGGGNRSVLAHAEHNTGAPCAPVPHDSPSHHSAPRCLVMTGCATTGIAAAAAPELAAPRVTHELVAMVSAPLASVSAAPETPPPIVI